MAAKKKKFERLVPKSWERPVIMKDFKSGYKNTFDHLGVVPESEEEEKYYMSTGEFVKESQRALPENKQMAGALYEDEKKKNAEKDKEIEELKAQLAEEKAKKAPAPKKAE